MNTIMIIKIHKGIKLCKNYNQGSNINDLSLRKYLHLKYHYTQRKKGYKTN